MVKQFCNRMRQEGGREWVFHVVPGSGRNAVLCGYFMSYLNVAGCDEAEQTEERAHQEGTLGGDLAFQAYWETTQDAIVRQRQGVNQGCNREQHGNWRVQLSISSGMASSDTRAFSRDAATDNIWQLKRVFKRAVRENTWQLERWSVHKGCKGEHMATRGWH